MSIPIIDIIKPLGNFPAVDAEDVQVGSARLDTVLNASAQELSLKANTSYVDEQIEKIPIPDVTKTYVDTNFALKSQIPKVPTVISAFANDADYATKSYVDDHTVTGMVTSVKVGNTSYNPLNGVVSIPEYPTTLPASDVQSWAKANTKPTYTKSEIGLSDVNNTSDADKPISTATQNALDEKASLIDIEKTKTYVTPQQFGAVGNGETDDTEAIQAAVNHGGVVVFPQGTYKITATIVIPCTTHIFASGLVRLNTLVNGFALHFKGEINGENDRYTEMSYPIIGGYNGYFYMYNMQVDNGSITGYNGIKIGDPSDDQQHFGKARIENVRLWFYDAAIAVTGHNFYLSDFDHVHAEFCTYGIIFNYSSGTDNSGENVNLNRCIFGNNKIAVYFNNSGTYTLQITRSSFDYNGKCISGTIDKRTIYIDNCHLEQNTHTKFFDTPTEEGGIINGNFAAGYCCIRDTVFVCHTNEYTKKFYVWGNTNNVLFENVSCYYSPMVLDAEKGFFLANQYVKVKNLGVRNDRFIMTSRDNNILYNGNLTGASATDMWGYVISVPSNMTKSIGVSSNKFSPNAHEIVATCNSAGTGYVSVARNSIKVSPRRLYACTFVGICSNPNASKNIRYQIFDAKGNEIKSGQGLQNDGIKDFRTLKNPNTACFFTTPTLAATVKLTFEMSADLLASGDTFKIEYIHLEDISNSDDAPFEALS